jgi:hypothetical protein
MIKNIEDCYKQNNLKDMYYLVKKATRLQKNGIPISGIKKDDNFIIDKDEVKKEVMEYYSDQFSSQING